MCCEIKIIPSTLELETMETNHNFSNHKILIISGILEQNKFSITDQSINHLILANFKIIEKNDSISDNVAIPILIKINKIIDVKIYTKETSDIYIELIRRIENLEIIDYNWLFQICLTWFSTIKSIKYQMCENSVKTFVNLYNKYYDRVHGNIIDKLIQEICEWLTINGDHKSSLNTLRQTITEIK